MKTLLFVCIGNACRSQMAEGFARHYGSNGLVVYSAGSHPAGFVAREAIEGMKEKGIDISKHYSKGADELPIDEFDAVVMMGSGIMCPDVQTKRRIEWEIPDPIGKGIEFFREVRDDLDQKVQEFLKEFNQK